MVLQQNNNNPILSQNQASKQSACRIKSNFSLSLNLIRFCVFMILVMKCFCTEMQIITAPTQENIKALNLMKSLRRFRVRYINLQNDTYACFTAVKQKPLDLKAEPSQKSKLANSLINGNVPSNCKLNNSIFTTHLNLLDDDIGVKHYTKQFIYGYKHKKIISQYDDQLTKYTNQKKQHENFTMGLFQLSLLDLKHKLPQKVQLTTPTYQNHLILKKQQPNLNLLENKQKPISLKYAHDAIKYAHIDHQRKMLILTQPIGITPHQVSKTFNITFNCEASVQLPPNQQKKSTYYNYTMVGVSVSNFQIVTMTEIPALCRSVLAIEKATRWALSFSPHVNVLDNLLVGDLDTMCNVKHDAGLNEGDFIILKTERNVQYTVIKETDKKKRVMKVGEESKEFISIQLDPETGEAVLMRADDQESEGEPVENKVKPLEEFFILEINGVKGENLYEINAQLPWTLKVKQCEKVKFAPDRRIDYSGQIKAGNKIPTQQYSIRNPQADRIIQIQTMGPKIIKKHGGQNSQYLQTGMDLFCMMELKFAIAPETPQIQYLAITIGKEFGKDHREVHPWAGFNLLRMFSQFIDVSKKISCVPYLSWSGDRERQNKVSPISRVIKMSRHKKTRVKFDNQKQQKNDIAIIERSKKNHQNINSDSILMITMSKDAVFEIQTTVYQQNLQQTNTIGQVEEIVDSASQSNQQSSAQQNIEDIEEQQSVNVVSHNRYYANPSKIYKVQTIYKNKTKIRLERVENQFYQNSTNENMIIIHNSIWRAGDFVKFPRFLFAQNQKITAIAVKFGTIFVRVIDLGLVNRQFFVVSSSQFLNHEGYGPRIRPQASLATEYLFKWGTFCGGNINKNRQTVLKIKCGQSWYKLNSVTETSPCVYEIQILSQYLCERNVVFPALKQGFNTFNGSMCLPASFYESM